MFDKKGLILESKPLDEIRPVLSGLSTYFIRKLQERSSYKQNLDLYDPEKFRGAESFFEFALTRKEAYYKAVGRFRHDSEFPITKVDYTPCMVGEPMRDPVSEVKLDLSGLVPLYTGMIPEICREGDNEGCEGQVIEKDIDAVMSLSRRVNAGRYVAQDKYLNSANKEKMAEIMRDYSPERAQELADCLIAKEQEKKVLDGVERFVRNEEGITLDEDIIRGFFRKIIDYTVDLEVRFLEQNYANAGNPPDPK